MSLLEERINDNVEYWIDEWQIGDNTVFKMELDEDDMDIDINWKIIDISVIDIWRERNYLYIELDKLALIKQFDEKWKEWDFDNKHIRQEYWNSRGV